MKHLYRLRTQKLFEKNREKSSTGDVELEDDPYSITNIAFSADTQALAVTGITDQVTRREGKTFQAINCTNANVLPQLL